MEMTKLSQSEKDALRTATMDILNDSEANLLSVNPDNQEISLIDNFGGAF